ncbi:DUF2066 domain-containing protein [Magnetospirillum sp. SS-4]|uniref:DUF2066 domain-containing protein n=1 Tax=Magnetospirillum sp. SS-4 TaxID=2681465 RepID=UPI001385A7F0|nr:DUF2066 domain-containing protein [Magnetospirillum sp. SS-4]CAA7613691.1 conserved exported hypothetical protein [Magnetospirillum sp. SS-4]
MASLRLVWGALILSAWLAASPAAMAADAFAVRGIDVDVTAGGVAGAKEQAMAEAERVGFRRLLERLTMPADHVRLPGGEAAQYVRDVSIERERSSAVRYIATLTVRYNPVAVKKLLRDSGIKYAEPRSRPVVIVPLFRPQGGGRPVLWDDPNPWRAAWAAQGTGGLVPLAVPAGDTADLATLTVDKALALDAEALGALGARFRTGDVVVAVASVNSAGTAVDVGLMGAPGVLRPFETRSYPLPDGDVEAGQRVAALDIAAGFDAAYKQQNLLAFDRAGTMGTLVPLRGLEDWLMVRERLGGVPMVRRWEIVSLSREEAALVLHTVGEPEQIKAALASAGLALDWNEGYWTMRLAVHR